MDRLFPALFAPSSSLQRQASADAATIPQRRAGRRLSWSEIVPIKTFLCPISGRLLEDPVITADGHTYEKKEIETWFRSGARSSPLTGNPLPHTQTIRNHALRNAIAEYMARLKSQTTVRTKVETNSEREKELEAQCDSLKVELAVLTADLQKATRKVNALEQTFQERAVAARLEEQSGGFAVGSSFVESLPPWLRRIAVIGARLESELEERKGESDEPLSPPPLSASWSPRSVSSSQSSPKSPMPSKSPSTLRGTVSDASMSALSLLVEVELEFLAEEAIRRAVRRRQRNDVIAASETAVLTPLALTPEANSFPNRVSGVQSMAMEGAAKEEVSQDALEESADMRAAELEAFSSLYEVLNGPDWENQQGWGSDPEYGRWYGIAVFGMTATNGIAHHMQSNSVRAFSAAELILPHNRLEGGPLPHQLGLLKNLTNLDLENNAIEGPLPLSLSSLGQLATLNLKDNALSGPLAVVDNLPTLTSLSLSWNNFTGPLPCFKKSRLVIRTIDISGNRLHGKIPDTFGNFIELRRLWLHFNRLSGGIPATIYHAKKLRELSLFENRLNGRLIPEIGYLTGLRKLLLASNKMTGRIPWEICNLTNLTELSLQNNLFVKDTESSAVRRARQLPSCRILI